MRFLSSTTISGFTLIELLIVVAIIGIIATLSVPILMRSRMSANEVAAEGAMKTITSAQTDYYNSSSGRKTFSANLQNLGNGNGAGGVPFIDPALSSGIKAGYTFLIYPGPLVGNNQVLTWSASAWPITYASTGVRSFAIDQSGVIRGSDLGGQPAQLTTPALD